MKPAPLQRYLAVTAMVLVLFGSVALGRTPGTGAISGIVSCYLSSAPPHWRPPRVPLLPPGTYTVTAPQFAVDETAILSLPLTRRNCTQILALAPGVVADLPNAAQLGRGTQNVASNGATRTASNIQFNGIDANNLVQNSASHAESSQAGTAIPAPDSIREFRVQTATFDAAYGRGTGANVDLVSKSGTSSFHGSAWESLRNNLLNANDFFLKGTGPPRPDPKQNQFGGSIGGPIVRDRTFFFAAYQGLTEVNGLGGKQTATLPMLTRDRSAATRGAQFCPAGYLDSTGQPAAGYLMHAGGDLDDH